MFGSLRRCSLLEGEGCLKKAIFGGGGPCCIGMRDFSSWTRDQNYASCSRVTESSHHWTTREVPIPFVYHSAWHRAGMQRVRGVKFIVCDEGPWKLKKSVTGLGWQIAHWRHSERGIMEGRQWKKRYQTQPWVLRSLNWGGVCLWREDEPASDQGNGTLLLAFGHFSLWAREDPSHPQIINSFI